MNTYIGTKVIQAEPQTYYQSLETRPLAGHEGNEKADEPGYKVVYEDGYVSWSPKDVFEKAYVEMPLDLITSIDKIKDTLDNIHSGSEFTDRLDAAIDSGIKLGISFAVLIQQKKFNEEWKESVIGARLLEPVEMKLMKMTGHYRVTTNFGIDYIDLEFDFEVTAEAICERLVEGVRSKRSLDPDDAIQIKDIIRL